MCLTIIKKAECITLKKELRIYKLINFDNIAVWQSFQYSPNTLYKKVRMTKCIGMNALGGTPITEIHKGYHAYTTKIAAFRKKGNKEKICVFYYPKGTKIYRGSFNHEIVGNQIKSGSLKDIVGELKKRKIGKPKRRKLCV